MESSDDLSFLAGIDLTENAPDDSSVLADPIDSTALLLRRFAWDTMLCSHVEALLPKLGLTLSTPEGTDHEHAESHHRMSAVLPFEALLHEYSVILSTVLSTAMTEAQGVAAQMSPEESIGFARQNAELILSGSRAMIAQLFWLGMVGYGPAIEVHRAHLDEHGNVVYDDDPDILSGPPDDDELPGQLSFGDLEHGSE